MKNLGFDTMKNNTLKQDLLNNKVTLGCWLTLAHPSIAEIMSNAGFDWVVIDLEHSVITIKESEELIRIIELNGATPLVRLTSNNEQQIKRVMDSGAYGIIVPMIKTVDDVNLAISSMKYPPKGTRGVGLARAHEYGAAFNEYLKWQDNKSIIIIQIEHIDAVNNLDSLFSVKEVDGYIVGPYDLSASMGIPGEFENKDYLSIMEKIKTTALKYNMSGGIHIVEPDTNQLKLRLDEGFKFIAYSLDTRMLDLACRDAVNSFNKKS
jgi:2-keto-3-deoxy-L-rhamnonate aldolase RhmA